MALGTSQGFLNFPKIKYLGGDSVSGKAIHVWHFFLQSVFQNDLPNLESLVIYRSCIAICEIRFRTVTSSPNCSEPNEQNGIFPGRSGASTISGDSAGDLENLTRTHDILF